MGEDLHLRFFLFFFFFRRCFYPTWSIHVQSKYWLITHQQWVSAWENGITGNAKLLDFFSDLFIQIPVKVEAKFFTNSSPHYQCLSGLWVIHWYSLGRCLYPQWFMRQNLIQTIEWLKGFTQGSKMGSLAVLGYTLADIPLQSNLQEYFVVSSKNILMLVQIGQGLRMLSS